VCIRFALPSPARHTPDSAGLDDVAGDTVALFKRFGQSAEPLTIASLIIVLLVVALLAGWLKFQNI
jgi:hypothetical protein